VSMSRSSVDVSAPPYTSQTLARPILDPRSGGRGPWDKCNAWAAWGTWGVGVLRSPQHVREHHHHPSPLPTSVAVTPGWRPSRARGSEAVS